MENLERYLAFIREAEKLKSVIRSAWSSDGREESTAEHSWRMTLLVVLFLAEYPELDGLKALKMALIHDMGELYGGDIAANLKPDPAFKYQMEYEGVQKVFGLLPEKQKQEWMTLWQEYNDNSSRESHLVKALDKAETIIQHNQGKNPPGFDYEFNLEYGAEYFKDDPLLGKLRQKLDEETDRRLRDASGHGTEALR